MKKSITTLGATAALAGAALLGAAPAAQADDEIVLSDEIISTLYEYYGVVR